MQCCVLHRRPQLAANGYSRPCSRSMQSCWPCKSARLSHLSAQSTPVRSNSTPARSNSKRRISIRQHSVYKSKGLCKTRRPTSLLIHPSCSQTSLPRWPRSPPLSTRNRLPTPSESLPPPRGLRIRLGPPIFPPSGNSLCHMFRSRRPCYTSPMLPPATALCPPHSMYRAPCMRVCPRDLPPCRLSQLGSYARIWPSRRASPLWAETHPLHLRRTEVGDLLPRCRTSPSAWCISHQPLRLSDHSPL
mmetsp:Transcript_7323/g.22504  ORF Transcript_7323/g.22504 Transcript_7323/m.22504 type:complete len:246 (-) Transcript_7323:450-1187(-)